jgi:hypothetical protein
VHGRASLFAHMTSFYKCKTRSTFCSGFQLEVCCVADYRTCETAANMSLLDLNLHQHLDCRTRVIILKVMTGLSFTIDLLST